jgi:hypothetical protein
LSLLSATTALHADDKSKFTEFGHTVLFGTQNEDIIDVCQLLAFLPHRTGGQGEFAKDKRDRTRDYDRKPYKLIDTSLMIIPLDVS